MTPAADEQAEEPPPTPPTPTPAAPVVQAPPPSNHSGNASQPPPSQPMPPSPQPAPPAQAPVVPVSVPIFWNGSLHVEATVCDASSCTYADPRLADDTFAPDVEDPILQATLVLIWEPASEITRALSLTVETCDQHACAEAITVAGTAPLYVELLDGQSRGNMRITVSPLPTPAPEGSVTLSAPQEFMLAGAALVLADASHPGFAGYDGDP